MSLKGGNEKTKKARKTKQKKQKTYYNSVQIRN